MGFDFYKNYSQNPLEHPLVLFWDQAEKKAAYMTDNAKFILALKFIPNLNTITDIWFYIQYINFRNSQMVTKKRYGILCLLFIFYLKFVYAFFLSEKIILWFALTFKFNHR